MIEQYEIRVVETSVALSDETLILEWERLLTTHQHPNAMYASPNWVAHLDATTDSPTRVWCVRDQSGGLVGLVPIRIAGYVLQFSVKNRILIRKNLTSAHILGSIPLVPRSQDLLRLLLERILADCPQCSSLYADSLPEDSYFWQMLTDSADPFPDTYAHIVDGPRPWHLIQVADSFESYLKTMSSKARANIRREVRKLDALAGGRLVMSRFTAEESVEEFLCGAAEVGQRSWQQRVLGARVGAGQATRESFEDLARRGLLRAYLLSVGESPCAFVIGYQNYGVYSYAEIGFDENLAKYSPGKVLLYLIIEDLHKHSSPSTLNFGVGDATYKRRFGNFTARDASCLIMRRNVSNRFFTSSHSLFAGAIGISKRLIGRKVTK